MPFCTNYGTEYFNEILFCSNCETNLESAENGANILHALRN
jgi:hypothetical protein